MNCPKCNNVNTSENKVCTVCGYEFNVETAVNENIDLMLNNKDLFSNKEIEKTTILEPITTKENSDAFGASLNNNSNHTVSEKTTILEPIASDEAVINQSYQEEHNNENVDQIYNTPKKKDNKKQFVIYALIVIGVIALLAITYKFIFSNSSKDPRKVFSNDDFTIKYSPQWTDETKDTMLLKYSDKKSTLRLRAVTSLIEGNDVRSFSAYRVSLYKSFYDMYTASAERNNMTITGGSGKFIKLDNGVHYAYVNYKTKSAPTGRFYIIADESKNKLISFMSHSFTKEAAEIMVKDIRRMLEDIEIKGEVKEVKTTKQNKISKFSPGVTKDYTALGYMDYVVPDSWTYNEEKSAAKQYKSYVFDYKDNKSFFIVSAATVMDYITLKSGTTYEEVLGEIKKVYKEPALETTKTFNGKKWFKIKTLVYTPNAVGYSSDYYEEIYFYLSDKKTNRYYLQFTVSDSYNKTEKEEFEQSIEYIMKSIKLQKDKE